MALKMNLKKRKKEETVQEPSHEQFFECTELLEKYPDARYYFVLSGRSTGKTYSVMKQSIQDSIMGRGLFAYVRRLKDSISDTYIQDLLTPHWDWLGEFTGGAWNRIGYWHKRWYLELWQQDEIGEWERVRRSSDPIGGAFAINTWETSKGPDFGAIHGIKNIIFDEALSKGGAYLTDEWGKWENVISSLVRNRVDQDTKIWMLANPVSKWNNCYFANLGITKKMYSGDDYITHIKYPNERGGESTMSTVFCYIRERDDHTGGIDRNAVYDTYFAFPNSKGKSKSITDGMWELDDSCRLPSGIYNDSTKNRTIYFKFKEELIACDVMKWDENNVYYLFFRPAEEIKKNCYYFTIDPIIDKYAIVGLKTNHPIAQIFNKIYATHQIFYSDNTTADAFHGFLAEAMRAKY